MAVVLITGASGGLGLELQRAFRNVGDHVIATDVRDTEHILDVRDAAACRFAADKYQPDVWINNAGVLGAGSAVEQDDQQIRQVVDVNLLGCVNGTRAALSVMRPRRSGRIINIGSLGSWVPVPGEAIYGATKAAVLSYSLALMGELRAAGETGIGISVVCPDGMLTPMLTQIIDDPHAALSYSGPHLAEPARVADRVVELVRRPRRVVSVPRWRGAMVRAFAGIPDYLLFASKYFEAIGRRNQERARSQIRAKN